MNHRLFGEVMELVHLDPYYAKVTTELHTNSIYHAVKHGKCIVHHDGHKLLGFCTYGFFTQEELDSRTWGGNEVYSRDKGEVLYFPKFQCRAGRKRSRGLSAGYRASCPESTRRLTWRRVCGSILTARHAQKSGRGSRHDQRTQLGLLGNCLL